jgi:hypothetical protein
MNKNAGSQLPLSYFTGSVQINTLCLCYVRATVGFDQSMRESRGVERFLHRLSTVQSTLPKFFVIVFATALPMSLHDDRNTG